MTKTIELELETDENGELHISRDQLGDAGPHTRYRVRVELERPVWGPKWAKMTPEERLADFQALVRRLRDEESPGLPLEAISRDSIYD